MPFNFDYLKNEKSSPHLGAWIDSPVAGGRFCKQSCEHSGVLPAPHWSCCGSTDLNCLKCSSKTPEMQPSFGDRQQHVFNGTGVCKICVRCGLCSHYGNQCTLCSGRSRRGDRGNPCGCGQGDPGCENCGLCRRCVIALPMCPRPSNVNQEAVPLVVGAHVFVQWPNYNDLCYPGVVSKVHLDHYIGNVQYDIHFDDGDFEERVPSRRVSLRPPPLSGNTNNRDSSSNTTNNAGAEEGDVNSRPKTPGYAGRRRGITNAPVIPPDEEGGPRGPFGAHDPSSLYPSLPSSSYPRPAMGSSSGSSHHFRSFMMTQRRMMEERLRGLQQLHQDSTPPLRETPGWGAGPENAEFFEEVSSDDFSMDYPPAGFGDSQATPLIAGSTRPLSRSFGRIRLDSESSYLDNAVGLFEAALAQNNAGISATGAPVNAAVNENEVQQQQRDRPDPAAGIPRLSVRRRGTDASSIGSTSSHASNNTSTNTNRAASPSSTLSGTSIFSTAERRVRGGGRGHGAAVASGRGGGAEDAIPPRTFSEMMAESDKLRDFEFSMFDAALQPSRPMGGPPTGSSGGGSGNPRSYTINRVGLMERIHQQMHHQQPPPSQPTQIQQLQRQTSIPSNPGPVEPNSQYPIFPPPSFVPAASKTKLYEVLSAPEIMELYAHLPLQLSASVFDEVQGRFVFISQAGRVFH